MALLTLQDEWASYARDVLPQSLGLRLTPAGAATVQVTELRQAFYAGASVALRVLLEFAEGRISEEAAIDLLAGLVLECDALKRDVTEGRA